MMCSTSIPRADRSGAFTSFCHGEADEDRDGLRHYGYHKLNVFYNGESLLMVRTNNRRHAGGDKGRDLPPERDPRYVLVPTSIPV